MPAEPTRLLVPDVLAVRTIDIDAGSNPLAIPAPAVALAAEIVSPSSTTHDRFTKPAGQSRLFCPLDSQPTGLVNVRGRSTTAAATPTAATGHPPLQVKGACRMQASRAAHGTVESRRPVWRWPVRGPPHRAGLFC